MKPPITIRDPEAIVGEWGRRSKPERVSLPKILAARLPPSYLTFLKRVGPQEITGDFVLPAQKKLLEENRKRDVPKCKLGEEWWVFSVGGTGDAWLLEMAKPKPEVAFLDHDEESRAMPRRMGIDLNGWIVLADLNERLEKLMELHPEWSDAKTYRLKPAIANAVKAEMNKIAPGLAKGFPLAL